MSNWVKPMVAAKNAVEAPTMVTTALASGRIRTSARGGTHEDAGVTMVAAWINAETGVGPSIASQPVWSGPGPTYPWRDEEQDAERGQRVGVPGEEGRSCRPDPGPPKTRTARVEDQEHAEDAQGEAEIADPVDEEGLIAAALALGFWNQKRSAGRRHKPHPFQPKNIWMKLFAVTSNQHADVNSER